MTSVALLDLAARGIHRRPPASELEDVHERSLPRGSVSDIGVERPAGDVLRVNATYETRRASWYESMGIMVVWEAWNDTRGVDPFTHKLNESEHLTHGHLAENNHHGGTLSVGVPLSKFKTCQRQQVLIAGFTFIPGDLTSVGANRCLPTVKQGQSLTFLNQDASAQATLNLFNPDPNYLRSIWHSVTACQSPCGLDTGISYPLANGAGNYDSGQLGVGTPAIGRMSWSTPTSLAPGTYTYYCRIHPFMRGAFKSSTADRASADQRSLSVSARSNRSASLPIPYRRAASAPRRSSVVRSAGRSTSTVRNVAISRKARS